MAIKLYLGNAGGSESLTVHGPFNTTDRAHISCAVLECMLYAANGDTTWEVGHPDAVEDGGDFAGEGKAIDLAQMVSRWFQ